jgi:hypothetical protein
MFGGLLALTLGGIGSFDAVLDFKPLTPLPNALSYRLTMTFTALDGKSLTFPFELGGSAEPEEVIAVLKSSFKDAKWAFRVDGNKVIVRDHAGFPVVGVKIESTGPRPTLEWVQKTPK